MLSVHGRRADGFHDLTSLAAPLDFGDELTVALADSGDSLVCDAPGIPVDGRNLVLRAAEAFREASGATAGFAFELTKRIPAGAGLGGGSSDAAAALLAMNRLLGEPLDRAGLVRVAARTGSDCPFFLEGRPAVMRGRGELLEPLDEDARARLFGRPVFLFGPPFEVSTAWAYGALAASGSGACEDPGRSRARLQRFLEGGPPEDLLHNSLQAVVGRKYLAIPALLERVRAHSGPPCLMSGSGSCCFALPPAGAADPGELEKLVREAWGPEVFWVETSLA